MKLKTFSLLLAFIICSSFTLFSQNNSNPNANPNANSNANANTFAEAHLQKLEQDIQLTDDQKKELLKEYKKLFNNRQATNTKSDRREEIKAKQQSAKTFEASLESILTTEQRLQLKQKREERKNQRRNNYLKNR